jgi:TPR repeat protein
LETTANGGQLLAEELTIGLSLREVVMWRRRRALRAPEVVRLLSLLAPLADHARAHRLEHVAFSVQGIQVFEQGASQTRPKLVRQPLTAWESLELKVSALELAFSPFDAGTRMSPAPPIAWMAQGGACGSYVRLLSLLAYELLGGPRARLEATGYYTPLSALTAKGNAVLRCGLADAYPSAGVLAQQLAAAVKARRIRNLALSFLAAVLTGVWIIKSIVPLPVELPALSVQTEPAGALVLLDGKPPQERLNTFTHVPFGHHQLTATLERYKPFTQDLEVHEGMNPQLRLTLEPVPPTELPVLSVQTEPAGASVLLDGKPPQQSPNTFTRIPFGHHRLTVTLKGYLPVQRDLEVDRATPPIIVVPIELPDLLVQTKPPGASVLLDGKPPQQPPNTFTHIPFGHHQLTGRMDNYEPITRDLDVDERTSPEIVLEFRPRPPPAAALSVQTEPPGAAVSLDGGPFQTAPNTFKEVKLGRHRLTAILEEYLPTQQDLQFEGAKPSTVALKQMDQGVWQEYVEARKLFQEAANAGSAAAIYNLGLLYINGWGVTQDYAQAREWFQKAANTGSNRAMNKLGLIYVNGWGVTRDYAQAREWFQQAADAGEADAMFGLGDQYAKGEGSAQDYGKARYWYQKAAEAGHAVAMNSLGVMYAKGEGGAQDYGKAHYWYQKAAGAGDVMAMVNLGVTYASGHGVAQDYAQAQKWFQKAAGAGRADAMYYLGELYYYGKGVAKDYIKSREWYQRAADAGNADAMYSLGVLYQNGTTGVAADYTQAHRWYQRAAEAGNTAAKDALIQLEHHMHQ